MEEPARRYIGYRLGPRVPIHPLDNVAGLQERQSSAIVPTMAALDLPSRVVGRADSSTTSSGSSQCTEGSNSNLCEKPVGSQSMTVPIVLGVAIPIVAAIVILLVLQRRLVVKQRKEDAEDPHKSLDFGMGERAGGAPAAKGKRKSIFFGGEKPQPPHARQLSMDMNLSSPYLLPPGLQGSRESLHSLARTLHQNEDPYRPVANYAGDGNSMRSMKRGPEGGSLYTASSGKGSQWDSKPINSPTHIIHPPRQNSLPKPPPPVVPANDPFRHDLDSQMHDLRPLPSQPPSPPNKDPFQSRSVSPSPPPQLPSVPTIPQLSPFSLPYPEDKNSVAMHDLPQVPTIQEPPQTARKGLPTNPRPGVDNAFPVSRQESAAPMPKEDPLYLPHMDDNRVSDLSFSDSFHQQISREQPSLSPEPLKPASPPSVKSLPSNPRPVRNVSPEMPEPIPEDKVHDSYGAHYDGQHADAQHDGQHERQPSQDQGYYDYYDQQPQHHSDDFDSRGRSMRRQSADYDNSYGAVAGLAVPPPHAKRHSVGFRPLPPDEIMESEDPEYRANRIRSFYKEYFEETKPDANPPPMPQPPQQYQEQYNQQHNQQQYQHNQQHGVYYEDYDGHYAGGGGGGYGGHAQADQGAYYDPRANSFVMPYAQPVQRRAMTPPPSNRFQQGPGGPGRRWHGSVGGMSAPGGPRGGPGFRPGSAASGRTWNGPGAIRPGSSASARSGQPRGKPKPPPMALTNLPNPAKLKDDSFAILGAGDFAPPSSFQERARGRSQSPAGERRPYGPKLPAFVPTASAFDDLAALPSPHLLRKSGTFTGLDFAPPRRFKADDQKSDSGSIRSNRSGISTAQLSALRGGAGRVSRLPGDQIFTAAASAQVLKPSWSMRD